MKRFVKVWFVLDQVACGLDSDVTALLHKQMFLTVGALDPDGHTPSPGEVLSQMISQSFQHQADS